MLKTGIIGNSTKPRPSLAPTDYLRIRWRAYLLKSRRRRRLALVLIFEQLIYLVGFFLFVLWCCCCGCGWLVSEFIRLMAWGPFALLAWVRCPKKKKKKKVGLTMRGKHYGVQCGSFAPLPRRSEKLLLSFRWMLFAKCFISLLFVNFSGTRVHSPLNVYRFYCLFFPWTFYFLCF